MRATRYRRGRYLLVYRAFFSVCDGVSSKTSR
jgi:hypothetical protein